ncbi:MAG TPA: peptidylprolyl isomerase [Rhodocyclaceae bacterium]|nr:peptidylprolyl isomerase [Rhodocyclaceae bacterium]
MKFQMNILATTLLALCLSAPALAQTKAKAADTKTAATSAPLARVNGVPVPAAYADIVVGDQIAQGTPDSPDLRKGVREQLVQREVVAQEARKKGLDKQASVQARLDLARQSVLVGAYLDDWARTHAITDAQAKTEYDRQVKMAGDMEYKARHILLDKEEDAVAIIKKLQAGEKFEDLVKDSKDPGSKDNGGDLGWSRASAYEPAFADALTKLEKGKFTPQPVKTQYGYHVILLDDTRKFEPPKFEEVKERIQQGLQQQAVQQHIQDLVSKAKVE